SSPVSLHRREYGDDPCPAPAPVHHAGIAAGPIASFAARQGLSRFNGASYPSPMSTLSIGVRRAETSDASGITAVHDAAWRYAYEGLIPAQELNRMIARRGAAWWERAIRRGTGILVLDVGGTVAGYATFGPNRARDLPQKGEVYELYLMPEYQS